MPHPVALSEQVKSFTKQTLCVVLAAVLLLATVLVNAAYAQTSTVARIAGEDRIDTAVQASQRAWSSADHAVLTIGDDYPDALAATAYAAEHDAPILLTHSDQLPSVVADELDRLDVDTVTVLGGEGAISAEVEASLEETVDDVIRMAGESRYDTARQLAIEVGAGTGGRVAVALGTSNGGTPGWADALSAASLAATDEPIPTLLTVTNELPTATVEAIDELDPDEVLIIGGDKAISQQVEDEIAGLVPSTTRVSGSNRYRTSVAVAKEAFAAGVPRDDLVFVSGEQFADALGAAAFAANDQAPMLLVPSERLADSVDTFVRDEYESFDDGLLIGGLSTVGEHVQSELWASLRGEERPQVREPEPEPEPEPAAPSYKGYTFRFDLALWDRLARCESGGNWSINTGNGYYGGIQFSRASWRAVGGTGYPHQHSRLEQIYRGERLQARQGWGAWPACSRKIGLR